MAPTCHVHRATPPPTGPLHSAYIDERLALLHNHSYHYYCCSQAKRYPRLQSREGGKQQADDMQMHQQGSSLQQSSTIPLDDAASSKRKRNRPGNPKPDAEVVALSPRTLLATNRFVCEVCHKGFQREQNLQLHLRGHNLPWKLKQKDPKEPRRRVYLCPEPTCVHHNPSRALGDLTGIKKHYNRKHGGEKNLKCDKCNKCYAVESDWKQHCKTCGTREYRCECNALFSRKDSFTTHRTICEAALAADHRETAQMPPPGAGLYVDSGSDSLRLSGAAVHKYGFADQGQSSSAAAAEASLFDHINIMPSYPGSSTMFRSLASDFSSSFFIGGGAPATNDQDLSEHGGDHYSEGSQGPLPHGKAPMHALPEYQPSSSNAYLGLLSGNSGGASGSQGPLPHGREPFLGHLMQLLPEQQQHHLSSSSTDNVNLPNNNLGLFSGNSGGWSGSSQDARLGIQDQFNGGAGGSNIDRGNVMASMGSHFGGGFSSQYNSSPSPSAGLSATALLMKAAQMGSTSSTATRTGPSALLRAAGFAGTDVSGQGTSRAAAEEGMSHEAHFHDLIMNSTPLMGGTGFSGTAGMVGVDDGGSLSTRDFLGVGMDDAAAPPGPHMGAQLDPTQMKWFM